MSLPYLFLDAAEPWQLSYQDSGSLTQEGIMELSDTVVFYLIFVLVGVLRVLYSVCTTATINVHSAKYDTHGTALELVWTVSPALVLLAIAFPSFRLLYLIDEVVSPSITVKVIGHQWY